MSEWAYRLRAGVERAGIERRAPATTAPAAAKPIFRSHLFMSHTPFIFPLYYMTPETVISFYRPEISGVFPDRLAQRGNAQPEHVFVDVKTGVVMGGGMPFSGLPAPRSKGAGTCSGRRPCLHRP